MESCGVPSCGTTSTSRNEGRPYCPEGVMAGLVDYILGAGTGSRLNTSDNCMILYEDAEYAFAISGKDWGPASPIREISVTVDEAFEMT